MQHFNSVQMIIASPTKVNTLNLITYLITLKNYYAPAPNRRGIKRCFCLTSVSVSVAYIGPRSRTRTALLNE